MNTVGDSDTRRFGDAVREQRKKLKISQEALAEYSDLHRTYIGNIERGEKNPSLKNIIRLAKGLKLKPCELFAKAGM